MKLYHFTAAELLPKIMEEGLSRGDVPIAPLKSYRAVWLTSLATPAGHGLGHGEELSTEAKAIIGQPKDRVIFMLNKRRIRIAVKIPKSHPNLFQWDVWSKKRLTPQWRDALHGADGQSYRTWFIYRGVIPPSAFLSVEDLEEAQAA